MKLDWLQIEYATFGAFLGSGISLIIAWITSFLITRKKRKIATNSLAERLKFNNERALQMLVQFAGGKEEPDYTFDTTGIIVWITLSAEVLEKHKELLKDVNWHRYQLDHINNRLSIYYLFITNRATDANAPYYTAVAARYRESICKHLETVTKDICQLIRRVEEAQ